MVFAQNAVSTAIPEALKSYAANNHIYPTTEQGLDAFATAPLSRFLKIGNAPTSGPNCSLLPGKILMLIPAPLVSLLWFLRK